MGLLYRKENVICHIYVGLDGLCFKFNRKKNVHHVFYMCIVYMEIHVHMLILITYIIYIFIHRSMYLQTVVSLGCNRKLSSLGRPSWRWTIKIWCLCLPHFSESEFHIAQFMLCFYSQLLSPQGEFQLHHLCEVPFEICIYKCSYNAVIWCHYSHQQETQEPLHMSTCKRCSFLALWVQDLPWNRMGGVWVQSAEIYKWDLLGLKPS